MNTSIQRDSQICISVPLSAYFRMLQYSEVNVSAAGLFKGNAQFIQNTTFEICEKNDSSTPKKVL